ncbi:MAG: hypothetical protein AB8H80_16385, partial [Planctomycetota bacterium]
MRRSDKRPASIQAGRCATHGQPISGRRFVLGASLCSGACGRAVAEIAEQKAHILPPVPLSRTPFLFMQRYAGCLLFLVSAYAMVSAMVRAQCELEWQPGVHAAGANGPIYASVRWDPDGVGPQPEMVVFGGDFTVAGDRLVRSLAMWLPGTEQWIELAGGVQGVVHSLRVLANGDLAVGGEFSAVGSAAMPVPASGIAVTDGAGWTALGGGLAAGRVEAITEYAGGLAIGGSFASVGSVLCSNVAYWDGASWFALNQGVDDVVNTLVVGPTGKLLLGGVFQTVDGQPLSGLASWDGSAFGGVAGVQGPVVHSMKLDSNGTVFVAGIVRIPGYGNSFFATFDGAVWANIGSGSVGPPVHFDFTPTGCFVAAASPASFEQTTATRFLELDGSSWSPRGAIGSGGECHTVLRASNGSFVAAGAFDKVNGAPFRNVARRQSFAWETLFPGADGVVHAVLPLANGDTVVGGLFQRMGGNVAPLVARFDGVSWQALANGPDRDIRDVVELANGDLVTAGSFGILNGSLFNGLARWDGASWSPIGALSLGAYHCLDLLPDGRVVAGSNWTLDIYDGVSLSTLAQPNADIFDVLALPGGDIVVAGGFTSIGSQSASGVARYDGQAWSAFGAGANGRVSQLAVDQGGHLLACGDFTTMGSAAAAGIARWDGTSWHAIGSNSESVSAMAVLPDGDIVIARKQSEDLARWDSATWSIVPGVSG